MLSSWSDSGLIPGWNTMILTVNKCCNASAHFRKCPCHILVEALLYLWWFKMQGLIYSKKKFHFAICNLMEYKETGKALYINTDVSSSEAFLCSWYLNGDQEWYCSVGLLFVYNTLIETRCQNGFPGLLIEFCRLTLHCEPWEPLVFFLKNSWSSEILKAAVFCHYVETACFSASLNFKYNVCTREKKPQ